MNEIIAKLKEAGKNEAFNSPEEFTAAAKSLGYSDEDISAAVGSISFPLSDDDLDAVTGGRGSYRPVKEDRDSYYLACKKCSCKYSGLIYFALGEAEGELAALKSRSPRSCSCGGICEPHIVYERTKRV